MNGTPRTVLLACVTLLWVECGLCGDGAVRPGSVGAASLAQANRPGRASGDGLSRGDHPEGRQKGGRGRRGPDRPYPAPSQAWSVATLILGSPTDRQISLSVTASADVEGYVVFGPDGSPFSRQTGTRLFSGTKPELLALDGLEPDTAYRYRFCYRKTGEREYAQGPVYQFHTQREAGSRFTFELQGDSHPERTPKQNDPQLYAQTLLAAEKDRPDFYICLGDDFSVDTLREVTAASVEQVYRKQLPYLGLVAHSSPLFLVNGNHEQAARCNLDGTDSNVAAWAQGARNRFFPQPGPGDFYSGDAEPVAPIGLLRDYYAWTWGDALFVVIDPYWHSAVPVDNVFGGDQKRRDLWGITLGEVQYRWLKQTLESSRARFKFVFAHHVNGTGRGGIRCADTYEWGGRGNGGDWEFEGKRPGWAMPIHQLMVSNGVTIFFQGHDHLFAREEKDGVIYQTVPEPADPSYTLYNKDAYPSGVCLPNSGRVRVQVAPEAVRVEYVRSYRPSDATAEHPDGEVAFAYTVPGGKLPSGGKAAVKERQESPPRGGGPVGTFHTGIPDYPGNVILGRPTDHSVTLSVMMKSDARIVVAYSESGKASSRVAEVVSLKAGAPCEVRLDGLAADTAYEYRVLDAATRMPVLPAAGPGGFRTSRTTGASFTFTVTADSHLDENTDLEIYQATLAGIRAAKPDFHVDLGDTFMTGKHRNRDSAALQYLAQRYYFGLIGDSVPLFLVLGNHDGEERFKRGGNDRDGLAVWSCLQRQRLIPNPVPDAFYAGNETPQPGVGLLQDYYAWTWGDALFMVLDPYWTSGGTRGGRDPWAMTLGTTQYDWLARTLRASRATFKFVFIHQLVGGLDAAGRGGSEAAALYEWGGHEKNGTDSFAMNRAGWGLPIHALLVETGVSAVFHGHDHFFARQERDGIVYQLVPQPGTRGSGAHHAAEYGYLQGQFLPGAGFLRVAVTPSMATVSYDRSPQMMGGRAENASAYRYPLAPKTR